MPHYKTWSALPRLRACSAAVLPLYALILAGFALRLFNLGAQSLWYDETVSAFLARQSVPALLAHTARDIHPPGYYLLLHFWTGLAGQTEFALAFLSLIFGLLLLALVYRLAHYLANPATALWTALLVAFSPFNISYSQEVRMYTMGATLGLAAAYCALQALAGRRRYWSGYVVAAAAGLYTLYYFAFLLVVLNLFFLGYLLLLRRYRASLLLMMANGLVLVAYLPWAPVVWRQVITPPVPPWRESGALSAWPVLVESWTALSLGQSVEPAVVWPFLLLTLVLFGLGLAGLHRLTRHRFPAALFLLLYTFGPLLIIYLASLVTPLYHVRYIFIYSPAFYISLSAGLATLNRTWSHRWPAWMAAALLLAVSLFAQYRFHTDPRYQADDFRAAIRYIEAHWQPGDAILLNAGYTYTAYMYYTGVPDLARQRLVPYRPPENSEIPALLLAGSVDGSPQLGWGDPQADFYAMSAADTVAALERVAQDFNRLWLLRVYDTVTDPDFLIRNWLAGHAILLEDQAFAGSSYIRVQAFLLPGQPPPVSPAILFEDGLALVGWALPEQAWQAGQTIPVKLWWAATAPPAADYKMSLKLWRPDGVLAAQGQDTWPAGSLYRATAWPLNQPIYQPAALPLPADLPPGQYWLNVELYHPETVQPLPLFSGEAAATLGPVIITR